MLGRDDDIDHPCWLAIDILHGDLALCIGSEPLGGTGFAQAGEFATEAVGIHDRSRHQFLRFIAGVSEHQPLIAGALLRGFLAVGLYGIHALSDISALRGDDIVDENAVGVEDVVPVVVADLTDCIADDLADVDCGFKRCTFEFWDRDLTADHHDVTLGVSLAGYPACGVKCQAGIKDGVGDRVADLVWMAFTDGFRGKYIAAGHGMLGWSE